MWGGQGKGTEMTIGVARAAGGDVASGGDEWACVEGRISVCGSEHEARVLVEGPGFGVGPVLEAARKPGRSERGHTGPGVTYSHGRGEKGMVGLDPGMALPQLLALRGL